MNGVERRCGWGLLIFRIGGGDWKEVVGLRGMDGEGMDGEGKGKGRGGE